MSRLSGVFWFILVIASGMTNFIIKQNVQGLDDQLNAVRKKAVAEQKAIHELTADWTFLNQPELLTDLNSRYIHLVQVSPKQVVTGLDSIPLRPAPTPTALDAAPQIAEALDPPPPPFPAPVLMQTAQMLTPASARQQIIPVAANASATAPARSAKPASLDGLFAQVSGGR